MSPSKGVPGARLRITRFDQFEPSKTERQGFDCGQDGLSDWLVKFAGQSMDTRDAVTYLLYTEREIRGYYTLSAGSIARAEATGSVARRAPDPIPVILLGRMAVDKTYQGQGYGSEMLRHAVGQALSAATTVGARCFLVHALNDAAQAVYSARGFDVSPVTPRLMMLPFKDIEQTYTAVTEAEE